MSSADEAISMLEAGQKVDTSKLPNDLRRLFAPEVQSFWMAIFSYDPADLIAKYDGPILILQGDADLQVSLADGRALKSAQPNAKLVELAQVNHVLKVAPSDRDGNFATYSDPSLPIPSEVTREIVSFIEAHK